MNLPLMPLCKVSITWRRIRLFLSSDWRLQLTPCWRIAFVRVIMRVRVKKELAGDEITCYCMYAKMIARASGCFIKRNMKLKDISFYTGVTLQRLKLAPYTQIPPSLEFFNYSWPL